MASVMEDAVKSKYGSIAKSGLSSESTGVRVVAEAFGYSADDLSAIPAAANMALSCGNPIATANLRPGETVVDLGSGGGLDVFLAARKVGPSGRAIGIDMTPEMIALARRNAEQAKGEDGQPLANVEYHQSTIDRLPLADASVDCVISNCVINLAPDKPAVLREIARVLKPGGRLAISDIALKRELPPELGQNLMAYVGCIAGAVAIEDYRRDLNDAGFSDVEIIDAQADLNVYAQAENAAGCCSAPTPAVISPSSSLPTLGSLDVIDSGCCSPCSPSVKDQDELSLHAELAALMRRYNVNDYAASVKIFAVKPAKGQSV